MPPFFGNGRSDGLSTIDSQSTFASEGSFPHSGFEFFVMARMLKVKIITPDATAYSDEVEMITLPGVEGQMGVYPQHVPLMTQMVPGEILLRQGGVDYSMAVGEGLVEITSDQVAILTDMAIAAEHIDEAKVEEARRRAEARLQEKLSDEEVASVNSALARSLAQLHVKRRHRK